MTKSSFSNMFNRLPIYTRPKEPAIGEPVLTESTNERLAGHAGIKIVGLDGRPRRPSFGLSVPYQSSAPPSPPQDFGKDLSQPPSLLYASDVQLSEQSLSDQSCEPTSLSLEFIDSTHIYLSDVCPPRPFSVTRKPAPLPKISNPNANTSMTSKSHDQPKRAPNGLLNRSSGSSPTSLSNKSSGFGLGNLVKERVSRRKPSVSVPAPEVQPAPSLPEFENEAPTTTVKPAYLNSIDDWLDSREKYHKRTNTITTATTHSTAHQRGNSELQRLHIRHSTFAPLEPLNESPVSENPLSVIPSTPSHFNTELPTWKSSLRRVDSIPSIPILEKASSLQHPPSPPLTPVQQHNTPRDYTEVLEHELELLESRKRTLRKEITDVEYQLPPYSTPSTMAGRTQLKEMLEHLNQEFSDVEMMAHDVGLKLYRAYRRKDKRDGYDGPPTHLWVSRVTGDS